MRLVAVCVLLLLGGCVVYEPPYRAPPSAAPVPRLISQEQAIDIAFHIARERGLQVDLVRRARLDAAGRWHVDVRGRGDRALVLLDARDGRLLKGRFKAHGGGDGEDGEWEDD